MFAPQSRIGANLRRIARFRLFKKPWPTAPIDRQYGISTSAMERGWWLWSGDAEVDRANVGYVGSQPSVVRHAIEQISGLERAVFADLGCGKGRILAVASEYPFRAVVGIEISKRLAGFARRNAAIIAAGHPDRMRIEVRQGDATDLSGFGGDDLVLFLYNSFRRPLVTRLIESITAWAARNPAARLYLVYHNCVHFDLFDDCALLERFAVEQIPFNAEELATSPFDNTGEAVATYRIRGREPGAVQANVNSAIRVTIPDFGAEITAG